MDVYHFAVLHSERCGADNDVDALGSERERERDREREKREKEREKESMKVGRKVD